VVDASFYKFLARNTNLPRSVHVEPTEIKLADHAEPYTETPPNIFIFVVDSMRKDYLAPYNKNVDFTPNVGQFAKDSVVMRNTFTRYGGTGLSEPSIWVGGAMIHKQYVTPFAPMNSLQKLIEAHDYQAFITRDSILQTVVTPWPKLKELDLSSETMEIDFCHSLTELASNLDAAKNGPVFAYTQPQNIHISVISRQGGKPIDSVSYGNFYAPYASRLRRIDGCFGEFIQTLKTRGLYDNSFIALTADHGDSLGEQGRWGHAYTIFPEIMRVPLIIHLPVKWQQKYKSDPDMLAFNSDNTPSLFYMLGHRPIQNNELLGKPLFAEHREELNGYHHDNYLVSSSYAAVYGILSGEGRFLYTADAVNLKDSWFDLSDAEPSARSVTSSMRVTYEKMIREKIELISREYKFPPM
jgi:arylsulfatase A-like enzyme